ncbi:NAD-dependent epimerase/dehydratase family protein [Nonomuraea sp. H19]|uniref:NAD-dependent epimerase/dehydratase family protein n=1 Tax=Nonomuraea sp. H19 TaxID=3452206 RepID=UPI003F8BA521
MARIAVLGARGFVGAALTTALRGVGHEVAAVTRSTYADHHRTGSYDVLVNAACPSRRYWAEHNPLDDHDETVRKTQELLQDWSWTLFVQVSSMSARVQPDTVYGRNRALAEQACETAGALIVRLGPMYGAGLTKGSLIDMLHDQPVYARGDSLQSFAPVEWCAKWIADHLDQKGVWEIGARTSITLREVRDAIGSRSVFATNRRDDQYPALNPAEPDWPVAADVVPWLRAKLTGGSGGGQESASSGPTGRTESARW